MLDRAPRTDRPRSNSEPQELERKLSLLGEPHVRALSDYVRRLRAGRPRDDSIPWFDPTEAGVNARILLLLEAPGRRATSEQGSGFISADNNDGSAHNMWRILREAGVDRASEIVVWNVVPWYIGTDRGIRAATATDIAEAHEALVELLSLLPRLKVVVLVGDRAADAWELVGADLPTIRAPHPSPKNLNSRPHYRGRIVSALVEARRQAGLAPRRGSPEPSLARDHSSVSESRGKAAPKRRTRTPAGEDDRHKIADLLAEGLTPEQVNNRLGPERAIWIAAIEEQARHVGELAAFPATPESVAWLRDERALRWEAIAARIFGDARKTTATKRLYDEARGIGAWRRSWTGRGRRFAEME